MKVIGHRGAAGEAPENTIAGCRHAIERGVRALELDVRLSSDNRLVVVHDASLRRTTYSKGLVKNLTASDLKRVDARRSGPPWPHKKECGIPTLARLISQTPEIERYFIEAKVSGDAQAGPLASAFASEFSQKRSAKKIIAISLNLNFLEKLSHLAPHITLGYIATHFNQRNYKLPFSCQHMLIPMALCNPVHIGYLRHKKMEVSAWTINDAQAIKNLYRMKVDNVITDYPSMALPLVASLERK